MSDGANATSELCFLSVRLAQKHYEHLRHREGDPLDVAWTDLPPTQKQLWVDSMSDLIRSLSPTDLEGLTQLIWAPGDHRAGPPRNVLNTI